MTSAYSIAAKSTTASVHKPVDDACNPARRSAATLISTEGTALERTGGNSTANIIKQHKPRSSLAWRSLG